MNYFFNRTGQYYIDLSLILPMGWGGSRSPSAIIILVSQVCKFYCPPSSMGRDKVLHFVMPVCRCERVPASRKWRLIWCGPSSLSPATHAGTPCSSAALSSEGYLGWSTVCCPGNKRWNRSNHSIVIEVEKRWRRESCLHCVGTCDDRLSLLC